jgi:transposase
MKKHDARKDSLEVKHERRKQVVRLHLKGKGPMEIAELTGLTWPTVRTAIDLYENGGWKALKYRQVGRRKGQGRTLDAQQEARVRRMINEKRPEQLKLDFALWNRSAVGQLIERECGVKLSVRAVGKYLKRWGYTPQKPIRRAYERNERAIQQWKEQEYPAIAMQARKEKAEIHWLDETAIVNTDVRGRSYAKRGRTPVVYAPGSRSKLSMISTVTNKGEASWEIIDGNYGIDQLLSFLKALIKGKRRKLYVIMDNLRAHHSKRVKEWVEDHAARIAVFYLPSYAPELNPDERLNGHLKNGLRAKAPSRNKAVLHRVAHEHMESITADPDLIKSFFQDPQVEYAA